MGLETFADKYDILKEECKDLKQHNSKLLNKISFYKEKSLRLDETMVANDSRIEKLASLNVTLEDHIEDVKGEMQEIIDKYRQKKKKIMALEDRLERRLSDNQTNIVITVIATFFVSLIVNYFIY